MNIRDNNLIKSVVAVIRLAIWSGYTETWTGAKLLSGAMELSGVEWSLRAQMGYIG